MGLRPRRYSSGKRNSKYAPEWFKALTNDPYFRRVKKQRSNQRFIMRLKPLFFAQGSNSSLPIPRIHRIRVAEAGEGDLLGGQFLPSRNNLYQQRHDDVPLWN